MKSNLSRFDSTSIGATARKEIACFDYYSTAIKLNRSLKYVSKQVLWYSTPAAQLVTWSVDLNGRNNDRDNGIVNRLHL